MDRTLILLLAALALVYLAWRSARREAQRAAAARRHEIERGTSTLEPLETDTGRGFVVVLPCGERSDEFEIDWDQDGLEIITVADYPATPEAAAADAFLPGSDIELIPEEDGSIWVWDRGMTVRAGRIPAERTRIITTRADANEIGDSIVLWEWRDGGHPTGIDILLVHRDTPIE